MFTQLKQDKYSRARTGILQTQHSEVKTPAYIFVGTNAKIRTLSADDFRATGAQILIANTYHLTIDPGEDDIAERGGLHEVMDLHDRTIMTDSGGFQVFSLGWGRAYGLNKIGFFANTDNAQFNEQENFVTVREDGVEFMDQIKNAKVLLTPERSIGIQEKLGADIIYQFDECTSSFHDYEYTKQSLERTRRWGEQCLDVHSREGQQLWGIIQGGHFKDLREEGARYVASHDFDGIGLGGPLGNAKHHMYEIVDWIHPFLPVNKARHFLGIGNPIDVLNAVERGMDLFDCVIPTREARHGRLWTSHGKLSIRRAPFTNDTSRIDEQCECEACESVNRSELRSMFKDKDERAGRLATIHNLSFFTRFMREIREAIENDSFMEYKKKIEALQLFD